MPQTVLILGASGRFGRNAADAFAAANWQVRTFNRKKLPDGIAEFVADAMAAAAVELPA